MSLDVAALTGNPKPASRTASVAQFVARTVAELDPGPPIVEIDLASRAAPDAQLRDVLATADVAIVASPTYKGTYTGVLKLFLDGLRPGALRGVVAVPVMVAAEPRHALAVDVFLRPLLLELGATVPTPGVFVEEREVEDLAAALEPWRAVALPTLAAVLGVGALSAVR